MSTKKRILFIANEMSPYVELTEFAEIINKLAVKANDSGMEVRCIMPRFGIINERRHRLHEVVVIWVVTDIAGDVSLLQTTDAVLKPGGSGDGPWPRQRRLSGS